MWKWVLRRHALPALLTGALVACLWPSGTRAADANAVAQDVLANPAFQSTFPGEQAQDSGAGFPDAGSSAPSQDSQQPVAPPSDGSTELDSQPPQDMPSEPAGADAGGGMDLRYLPMVLAAVAFLILAFYLLAKLRRQPAPASAEGKTPAPRRIVARTVIPAASADAPPPPPGPLDDAEQLAAAGRFSEAIHLVLLRLLAELRHLVDLSMADSLTSREILRRNAALPAATREALGVVIGAVELCHFGGRRGDATLFRHCVDAYMRATGRGAAATGAT
jgi:hypothetical protein